MGVLDKTLDEGNKQFPAGSSKYLKLQEGDNKIRIVSPLQVYGRHYVKGAEGSPYKVCIGKEDGCPYCESPNESVKKIGATYFCWIVDRVDGKIKEANLTYPILKSINDVTETEEYNFVPKADGIFPYDLNIRLIEGKGNEKRQYNIIPSPKTDISPEGLEEIKKLKHPMKVVAEMKGRKPAEETPPPTEENMDVESIPF